MHRNRHRGQTARRLEKMVEKEINDLAMKARFSVVVSASEDESGWSAEGFDTVEYLISANPGEPLGPVDKIASGGELSRVMLALKATVVPVASRAGPYRSGSQAADFRVVDTDEARLSELAPR